MREVVMGFGARSCRRNPVEVRDVSMRKNGSGEERVQSRTGGMICEGPFEIRVNDGGACAVESD